jgi:Sulfatase
VSLAASPNAPAGRAVLATWLETACGAALVVVLLELGTLAAGAPAARSPATFARLSLATFGVALAIALPLAALALVGRGRSRLAQTLRYGLPLVALGLLAQTLGPYGRALRTLAADEGWGGATSALTLGAALVCSPAVLALRAAADATPRGRVLARATAGLLVACALPAYAFGARTFFRLLPSAHAWLGVAVVGAALVAWSLAGPRARLPRWLVPALLTAALLGAPFALAGGYEAKALATQRGLVLAVPWSRQPLPAALPAPEVGPRSPSPSRPPPSAVAPPGEASLPRLIVLVTIDALRADVAAGPGLPTLQTLRESAVRFEGARTTAGYTLGALYGLMTSRGPWSVRRWAPAVLRGDRWVASPSPRVFPADEGTPTLALALAGRGYATRACASTTAQLPGAGLTRGFEAVDTSIARERNLDDRGVTADRVAACAAVALDAAAGRPLFLWVHYFDPHAPYLAHDGAPARDGSARARYEAEVAFVDRHLGALVASLEGRVGADKTFWIITADHGEAFGEHGDDAHVYSLYDEIMRVPLWFRGPQLAPRDVATPVSLLDVAPTLLDLVGAPALGGAEGRSLRGALQGGHLAPAPVAAETRRLGRDVRAVVSWPDKLIYDARTRSYELYDLDRDPAEQHPTTDHDPAALARLATIAGVPPR